MTWGFNRKGRFKTKTDRFQCSTCKLNIITLTWASSYYKCPNCSNPATKKDRK